MMAMHSQEYVQNDMTEFQQAMEWLDHGLGHREPILLGGAVF